MHFARVLRLASRPLVSAGAMLAGLWLGMCGVTGSALAQAPASAPVTAQAASSQPGAALAPASRPSLVRSATAAKANGKHSTKPLWRELSPAEQQALTPLGAKWDTISDAQKRKWLALSQNFPKMSSEEQGKLHSRMSEWAALSPQQRTEKAKKIRRTICTFGDLVLRFWCRA